MKFIVAQLGARRHYAIPRMLHYAGMLEHFYTDICAVKGWPKLLSLIPEKLQPDNVKKLTGRFPFGVPAAKITAFTRFGFEYARRRANARDNEQAVEAHVWAARMFCRLVIESGLTGAEGVYTFDDAGLELLDFAQKAGMRRVMEQCIVPKEIVSQLLCEEQERFPNWEKPIPENGYAPALAQRARAEWDLAELIICGSEFVREGIQACGGPVEKCAVVPYGVDPLQFQVPNRPDRQGPLRVLTVGSVELRKGTPYVVEAAQALGAEAQFRMVGTVSVLPEALNEIKKYVEIIGPVPRTGIRQHYEWADVFLFPSLAEGSAMVCYEALASGLPVITTRNAGSIVRNGLDGFIVPIRDSNIIAQRIKQLAGDGDLLKRLSNNARERRREASLNSYQERLISVLPR